VDRVGSTVPSLLQRIPQFEVFGSHEGIQLVRERPRQLRQPDDFLHVRKILQTVRGGESGRELQFEQGRERQQRDARTAFRRLGRIGKCDRLPLSVSRIRASQDDVGNWELSAKSL
jgi:hypothetical protein